MDNKDSRVFLTWKQLLWLLKSEGFFRILRIYLFLIFAFKPFHKLLCGIRSFIKFLKSSWISNIITFFFFISYLSLFIILFIFISTLSLILKHRINLILLLLFFVLIIRLFPHFLLFLTKLFFLFSFFSFFKLLLFDFWLLLLVFFNFIVKRVDIRIIRSILLLLVQLIGLSFGFHYIYANLSIIWFRAG